MLVRFLSSETGELLMYDNAAGQLLRILGKETKARGSFMQDEMLAASVTLRDAVKRGEETAPKPEVDEDDETVSFMDKPVAMGQRAWPLIDMLERSSRGGPKANIVWEAARDF